MSATDPLDESADLSPRARSPVVHNHYTQHRNGGTDGSKINTILLGCLLAIVGFLGIQIWNFNDRLARLETSVTILTQRVQP